MKQIMEQYGKLLLCVMIGGGLLALVCVAVWGKQGLMTDMQQQTQVVYDAPGETYDGQQMMQYASRRQPQITYAIEEQKYGMKAKVQINIADFFQAADADGKQIPVQVYEVKNELGESIKTCIDESCTKLTFPEAGIYTLYLQAVDAWNVVRYEKLRIPVN